MCMRLAAGLVASVVGQNLMGESGEVMCKGSPEGTSESLVEVTDDPGSLWRNRESRDEPGSLG